MDNPRVTVSISLTYDSSNGPGQQWSWQAADDAGFAATWSDAVRAAIAAEADRDARRAAEAQAQADRQLKESVAIRALSDPPAARPLTHGDRVRYRTDHLDRIGHPKDGTMRRLTGHVQVALGRRIVTVEWDGWPASTEFGTSVERIPDPYPE